jgi:alanine racemase
MLTLPSHRRAWIEVDLDAVVANAAALHSLLPASTRLMAVVKADAYGHGAIPVALALERSGVNRFGVATLDEGLALRDAGIRGRILVLYDIPADAVADARAASLDLSAGSLDALGALVAGAPSGPFVHLKIDTGMTRQGVRLTEIEPGAAELREAAPFIAGIWTHLRDGADAESAAGQRAAFRRALDALAALGVRGERHVSASAAILSRAVVDEDVARPGLALYGAVPDEFAASGGSLPVTLRPAMAVRARPVRLVEVPAGTPVGYGGTFVTDAPSRLAPAAPDPRSGAASLVPRTAPPRRAVPSGGPPSILPGLFAELTPDNRGRCAAGRHRPHDRKGARHRRCRLHRIAHRRGVPCRRLGRDGAGRSLARERAERPRPCAIRARRHPVAGGPPGRRPGRLRRTEPPRGADRRASLRGSPRLRR